MKLKTQIVMKLKTQLVMKLKNSSFFFLKALTLWADAFYKSKCPCVCPCVRLFTFEVPFKRLFCPTS